MFIVSLLLFYYSIPFIIVRSAVFRNDERSYNQRRENFDKEFKGYQMGQFNTRDIPKINGPISREVIFRSREKCFQKCLVPCGEVTASLSFDDDEGDFPQDILFKCLRLKPPEKGGFRHLISTSPPLIAAAVLLIAIILMLLICIVCSIVGSCKRKRRLERNRLPTFNTENIEPIDNMEPNRYVKVSADRNGLIKIEETEDTDFGECKKVTSSEC
uniref:Apple domain-containing protein n=1 Tax=Strongyloides venezuelensis TaxID=75913 RepID=A0A0K0FKT6_STRVS